ncbi:hypothetical protein Bca4012_063253 [Brassica carinata]
MWITIQRTIELSEKINNIAPSLSYLSRSPFLESVKSSLHLVLSLNLELPLHLELPPSQALSPSRALSISGSLSVTNCLHLGLSLSHELSPSRAVSLLRRKPISDLISKLSSPFLVELSRLKLTLYRCDNITDEYGRSRLPY